MVRVGHIPVRLATVTELVDDDAEDGDGSSADQFDQGAVERCAGSVIPKNMERSAPVENVLAMQDWRIIGIVWKVCSLSFLYGGL